ncbi:MAG: S46 family peptidase [Bacteroidota bacterium]
MLFSLPAMAVPDEGMWLPMYLGKLNLAEMQKLGLKLSAEQLYSINNGSLKDAVVQFDNGCTGEIVSAEGLLLTNHHCGYESIQSQSTVEHDYLSNGFWAMKRSEELPIKGLSVTFLVRMEDISTRILSGLRDDMSEADRSAAVAAALKLASDDAIKGTNYKAITRAMFNGNQYFLFVYEIFRDVRLVGTPPSSIGKFGGDTDNWMWPRHTGDFSMFRVYAGPDNKPADYSTSNLPLKPRHFLPVSMEGVKKDDFAMIFGFPGRTDRYLTSYGVNQAIDMSNPLRVKVRARKLEIMKKDMDANKKVQIQYASKYAQVSNYWKYFIGQTGGLKRLKVSDKKAAEEKAFRTWVAADPKRTAKYGTALDNIAAQYRLRSSVINAQLVFGEGLSGADLTTMASYSADLAEVLKSDSKLEKEESKKKIAAIKASAEDVYKDYNRATDEKLMASAIGFYKSDVPSSQWPSEIASAISKSSNGNYDAWVHNLYEKSIFSTKEKFDAFIAAPSLKKLESDPATKLYQSAEKSFKDLGTITKAIALELEHNNRLYVGGTMEMLADSKKFYPNANSTMRVTYGQVLDYSPRDAVQYNYFTTLDGIIQKEDTANPEFEVPAKLKELWKNKDFGPYGENGTVKVGFLSNTDITGGNSGSPVLNARGELLGLAFDGNWEAMSGDIAFEPELQRTISVDIRYVLFIIDKFAGAGHLVKEMVLAKAEPVKVEAPKPAEPEPAMMMQGPRRVTPAPDTRPAKAPAKKAAAKKHS